MKTPHRTLKKEKVMHVPHLIDHSDSGISIPTMIQCGSMRKRQVVMNEVTNQENEWQESGDRSEHWWMSISKKKVGITIRLINFVEHFTMSLFAEDLSDGL